MQRQGESLAVLLFEAITFACFRLRFYHSLSEGMFSIRPWSNHPKFAALNLLLP